MNTKIKKESKPKLETINVSLEIPRSLEQHLNYLEIISKKSKDFIIKEALLQYLEDAEDQSKVAEWVERSKNSKSYTSEEVDHFLRKKNLKELNA